MMSARSGLRPGTVRRSSVGIAASASRMCSTSTRGTAVACTLRAVTMPRREVHAGEVGEGAARADELRAAPVAPGKNVFQRAAHVAAQARERLVRGSVAQIALGEPERAERERHEVVEHAVGGERELERASADVHHDRAALAEIEVRERAQIRETRFVRSVDDAQRDAGLLAHARDELVGVRRVAHRARRHGVDAMRAELPRERGHAADGFGGRLHRPVRRARRSHRGRHRGAGRPSSRPRP